MPLYVRMYVVTFTLHEHNNSWSIIACILSALMSIRYICTYVGTLEVCLIQSYSQALMAAHEWLP